ncbi:MAG: 6-carboxytetrahydropterin synthase [Chloroflexota bacterium]|nr:6-carboxytetrahydropterin synthase [Dehalococcoidia bacterium]MDW8253199.1 6-carboxytetrahydropterin synthase [Chloroflexota bacterium]
MYRLAVRRDFISQHFLIGGDWGPENAPHSHHYVLEARLEGEALDQHGYLVDIVAVESLLDRLISQYRDRMLNDLPEFEGRNPSLEHFARILCKALDDGLSSAALSAIEVRLWENENAWASFRIARSP